MPLPLRSRQIERIRRQRLIGRGAERSLFEPFFAGVIMVCNRFKPPCRRIFAKMVECDDRVRQVVEQRIHPLIKQRQPMLHAGIAAAGRDRFVKRVVAFRRAEQLDIALAEVLDGRLAGRHFADGQERDLLARGLRALRDGIERPDAFERIAEEIEPHGTGVPRREEVQNAAAHRVFARLHDGARAIESRRVEPLDHLVHAQAAARRKPRRRLLERLKRGHALEHGVDRCQDDDCRPAALCMSEPRQGGDAARFDVAVGRDAVIGNAVPGRKGHHLGVRRKEFELASDRRKPLIATRDMKNRLLKRGIGRKPARYGGQKKSVVALGHPRGHNRALAAGELIECGWCRRLRRALLVEGS